MILFGWLLCAGPVLQPQTLERFAHKLQDTGVVRVLHIGDSHVQGANFAAEFRRLIQIDRGDAGRGLAFSHRLAGTNGATDLAWTGDGPWAASNGLRRENCMTWGIAGWSLAGLDSGRLIRLCPSKYAVPGRLLSKSALLFGQGVHLQGVGQGDSCGISCRRYSFAPSDSFQVQLDPAGRFDGLMLENGQSGAVWSEMGINGLAWSDLPKPSRMWEEINAWDPDLIVVSLGTNDAYAKAYSAADFAVAVQEGVRRLRLSAPNADIILTLPPDHALKARHRRWTDNPHLPSVEAVLREACRRDQVAGVEVRELMGGPGSWADWGARKLMAADHVHYTTEGYRQLADLIYGAIREAVRSLQPAAAVAEVGTSDATRAFLAAQDSLVAHKEWVAAKPISKPKPKLVKRTNKFRHFKRLWIGR